MSAKPTLTVTADFTEDFQRVIARFKNDEVLVGIPEAKTDRQETEVTNASILAINEFGSPANNIPARPVMAIGIRDAQKDIVAAFESGARRALTTGVAALSETYNRVGIIASVSIKKAINSQIGIAPPSEATLAIRKAKGFSGTKALIVTGQMRNSITYVVKGET